MGKWTCIPFPSGRERQQHAGVGCQPEVRSAARSEHGARRDGAVVHRHLLPGGAIHAAEDEYFAGNHAAKQSRRTDARYIDGAVFGRPEILYDEPLATVNRLPRTGMW